MVLIVTAALGTQRPGVGCVAGVTLDDRRAAA
jgi:hypothetical protein